MWTDVMLVAVAGGVIALDRTAAFQVMVSRPIVAAPVMGLLLGHPLTGLLVGLLLELIWISRLPLGGFIPPNECLGALLATASIILAGRNLDMSEPTRPLIVLGLLAVLPLAHLASFLERHLRGANGILVDKAYQALAVGRVGAINRLNLVGLLFSFLGAALFLLVFTPVLVGFLRLAYPWLTAPTLRALDWMYLFLPMIGVASALSAITVRRAALTYGVLFLSALGLLSL